MIFRESQNLKDVLNKMRKYDNVSVQSPCFGGFGRLRLHWSKAAGAVKKVVVFAPASYCCISLLYILMVPYAIKSSCENSSHRFACAILQDIHRKLSVFLHKRQPDQQCHQPQAGCPDLTSRWMSLDTFDVRSSSSDATGCLERLALVLLCLHPRAPPQKKKTVI